MMEPKKKFLARHAGARCAVCGVELTRGEILAMRSLRLTRPLCRGHVFVPGPDEPLPAYEYKLH